LAAPLLQQAAWLGQRLSGLDTGTAAVWAAYAYSRNRWHERRQASLAACEGIVRDDRLRSALNHVATALRGDAFPTDLVPAGTPATEARAELSFVLNHIETVCQGVPQDFYSPTVVREYFRSVVGDLSSRFLVPSAAHPGRLISVRYLYEPFENLRGVFGLWPEPLSNPEALATRIAEHAQQALSIAPDRADWTRPVLERLGRMLRENDGPNARRWGEQILWLLGYEDEARLAQRRLSVRTAPDFQALRTAYRVSEAHRGFWRVLVRHGGTDR